MNLKKKSTKCLDKLLPLLFKKIKKPFQKIFFFSKVTDAFLVVIFASPSIDFFKFHSVYIF